MLGAQSLQELLDGLGQSRVRHSLGDPASVPTCRRNLQERENSDTGSLMLI